MEDFQWNHQKISAAARLQTFPDSLQLLLLVPISVETRWIGHQVSLFKHMNIQITEVETVEAQFQAGRLKLLRIYLKDGSSRQVHDRGCA